MGDENGWEELDKKFLAYAKDAYIQALTAVWDLDQEDEDYYAQVAEIWSWKDLDLWRHARELMAQYHEAREKERPPKTIAAAKGLRFFGVKNGVFPIVVANRKGAHFVNGDRRFMVCGSN